MKKLLFYSCLVLIALLFHSISFSQEADSCYPRFKDVYNFDVGDVFQYDGGEYFACCGTEHAYCTKYQIVNKDTVLNKIKYYIEGITCNQTITENPSQCNSPCIKKCSTIQDSLIYIDSANNFLNMCRDEYVLVDLPYDIYFESCDSPYFFKVKKERENNIMKKIIGKDRDILCKIRYVDSLKIDTIGDMDMYEVAYGENLGLMSMRFITFEYGKFKSLIGYIKGNDTTGTVYSDEEMLTKIDEHSIQSKLLIYPDPAYDFVYLEFPFQQYIINVEVYDILGRLQLKEAVKPENGNIRLQISQLNPGIYYIFVKNGNDVMTGKIIKR